MREFKYLMFYRETVGGNQKQFEMFNDCIELAHDHGQKLCRDHGWIFIKVARCQN